MTEIPPKRTPQSIAEQRVQQILRAADSWAADVPPSLTPAVRAVCLRLGEMIADARHEHLLNPEPLEPEAIQVLDLVAVRLREPATIRGLETELEALTALELRATGSWAMVPSAQSEWTATAINYLEQRAAELPAAQHPGDYWADDLVAGVIASIRALVSG
ncbi:MAG TPA: hypothetical protein VFV65_04800 [Gemmatimonadales bacterium]|nr:hypothetical protein [Gemmatimonadales bacterium]